MEMLWPCSQHCRFEKRNESLLNMRDWPIAEDIDSLHAWEFFLKTSGNTCTLHENESGKPTFTLWKYLLSVGI